MDVLNHNDDSTSFTLITEGLFLCFDQIEYNKDHESGPVMLYYRDKYLGMINGEGRQAFLEAYLKAKESIQAPVTSDLPSNGESDSYHGGIES